MFEGFSQATIDFLWGLKFNNERSWFLAHKAEFQQVLDGPMKELAREVAEVMQEEFPDLQLQLKVSRIYRDARRLFGRGPYKDHLWFSLRKPGEKDGAIPCLFFEVAPNGYSCGMGCYDPRPVTMAKLRARIDRDPKPLEKLARRLEKHPEYRMEGERYKRPKGDVGPLLNPWYNSRHISVVREDNCEGIFFTPELKDQILADFRFLAPYYAYLRQLPSDPVPGEEN